MRIASLLIVVMALFGSGVCAQTSLGLDIRKTHRMVAEILGTYRDDKPVGSSDRIAASSPLDESAVDYSRTSGPTPCATTHRAAYGPGNDAKTRLMTDISRENVRTAFSRIDGWSSKFESPVNGALVEPRAVGPNSVSTRNALSERSAETITLRWLRAA